jgi:hypothetical protein
LLYMGSILTSTVAMIAAWLLYRKSANTVLGDAQ